MIHILVVLGGVKMAKSDEVICEQSLDTVGIEDTDMLPHLAHVSPTRSGVHCGVDMAM